MSNASDSTNIGSAGSHPGTPPFLNRTNNLDVAVGHHSSSENPDTDKSKASRRSIPKGDAIKVDDDDVECWLCNTSGKEEVNLSGCRHVFCYGCIRRWAFKENTCPFCKARFMFIIRADGTKTFVPARNQSGPMSRTARLFAMIKDQYMSQVKFRLVTSALRIDGTGNEQVNVVVTPQIKETTVEYQHGCITFSDQEDDQFYFPFCTIEFTRVNMESILGIRGCRKGWVMTLHDTRFGPSPLRGRCVKLEAVSRGFVLLTSRGARGDDSLMLTFDVSNDLNMEPLVALIRYVAFIQAEMMGEEALEWFQNSIFD